MPKNEKKNARFDARRSSGTLSLALTSPTMSPSATVPEEVATEVHSEELERKTVPTIVGVGSINQPKANFPTDSLQHDCDSTPFLF